MLAERLFRLALGVYPRRFRDHVGGEMCLVFRRRYQDTRARRGTLGAASFLLSEMLDVVKTAASQWTTNSDDRRWQQEDPRTPRSTGRSSMIEALGKDGHHAARSLARSPAFTVVVAVTLALGIGGTSAVFTVVNAVLLEPLPYEAPDRLMVV